MVYFLKCHKIWLSDNTEELLKLAICLCVGLYDGEWLLFFNFTPFLGNLISPVSLYTNIILLCKKEYASLKVMKIPKWDWINC